MPAELTKGTTPTTRNPGIDFVNFRHPVARTENFGGTASWMDNRYKLLVFSKRGREGKVELFDLASDPREEKDVAAEHPDVVKTMRAQLWEWQRSVERSLTGADYK